MSKESGKEIWLGDYHQIVFDQPLPAFDSEGGNAYVALERQERSRILYALVGKGRLPRREHVLSRMLRDPVPHSVRPLVDGVITRPDGNRNWAVILECPEGGSLAAQARVEPFSEDVLRRVVLPQALAALEQLHGRGLIHRSIRPSRLFWKDAKQSALVFGECFSEPPAYSQPAIYEPVERAGATRAGRGEGVAGCDLYALGATLVALAAGEEDPFGSSEDLLDMRLVRGSATLMLSRLRLSSDFKQALHGLLADDLARRWTMADLRLWLKGAQPAAKAASDRTLRPITFAGQSFGNRRLLARALGRARDGTDEFIRSPTFVNWVQNGLNDPEAARRIRAVLTGAEAGPGQGFGDGVAIQRILDPIALLPAGRRSVAADGLGPALAEAYREDAHDQLSAFAKLFQSGLAMDATEALAGVVEEPDGLRRTIAYLQSVVGRAAPGAGLERALYDLNPGLPCCSPLLGDAYVLDVRDLLLALDMRAGQKLPQIVDRHIAAFVAARMPQAAAPLSSLNGPPSEAARLGAELALFAGLQRAAGNPSLPGLTGWFADSFRRFTDKFHGAKNRARAERVLKRLADCGDLGLLRAEVDLDAWSREDETGYRDARALFQQNLAAAKVLSKSVNPDDEEAIRAGHRGAIAAAYCGLLLSIFLSLMAS